MNPPLNNLTQILNETITELEPNETQKTNRELTQKNEVHAKNILISLKKNIKNQAILIFFLFFNLLAVFIENKTIAIALTTTSLLMITQKFLENKKTIEYLQEKYGYK